MIDFRKLHPKIVVGYALGVAAVVIVAAAAWNLGEPRWLNCLVSLFGGLLGWWFGILASPLDEGERRPFSEFGKTILAFVGGFLFAKIDAVFDAFLIRGGPPDQLFVERALLLGIAFCLGALFTFFGRRYARS
ncbi:MAG TPA: hypothetical protein VFB20_08985 [Burkholderiales bacterium]|nr:hypothetical protein [Burkholderiales bacterium]